MPLHRLRLGPRCACTRARHEPVMVSAQRHERAVSIIIHTKEMVHIGRTLRTARASRKHACAIQARSQILDIFSTDWCVDCLHTSFSITLQDASSLLAPALRQRLASVRSFSPCHATSLPLTYIHTTHTHTRCTYVHLRRSERRLRRTYIRATHEHTQGRTYAPLRTPQGKLLFPSQKCVYGVRYKLLDESPLHGR